MFPRQAHILALLLAIGASLLLACVSPPTLISKHAGVPVGVDLSGNWLIRKDSGAAPLSGHREAREPLVPLDRVKRSRRKRSSGGVSAQVFLEFGESLKITQTYFGLFISYDRSVVEEYTYGENRIVSIGPIEAMRVSGWEGTAFAVETLDDSGSVLYESWHLEEDGTVLVRDIRISQGDKDRFVQQQVFDRQ